MRGLVLGKFLPYHVGHAHLIREARRQVDELVVLVCSIEREAIPGGLRFQWVRKAHPDCRVVHVAAALAARCGTVRVPEFDREYCEGRDPRLFSHVDFESIAWGQATLEEVVAADANGLLVCDTELHTTCTWSDLILGECRDWIRAAAAARRYDAILLLGHDLPWVNDGTRVLELRRAEHRLRLEEGLRRAGRTWIPIEGTPAEREAAAIRAIDQVLRSHRGPVSDVRVG